MASPRLASNNHESNKMKGESSPANNKTSVVSGLSIISQLSFVKNSFSSPNAPADGTKANSQKSFEQVTLMQEENATPSTKLRRTHTHQASKTELRLKK